MPGLSFHYATDCTIAGDVTHLASLLLRTWLRYRLTSGRQLESNLIPYSIRRVGNLACNGTVLLLVGPGIRESQFVPVQPNHCDNQRRESVLGQISGNPAFLSLVFAFLDQFQLSEEAFEHSVDFLQNLLGHVRIQNSVVLAGLRQFAITIRAQIPAGGEEVLPDVVDGLVGQILGSMSLLIFLPLFDLPYFAYISFWYVCSIWYNHIPNSIDKMEGIRYNGYKKGA